MCIEQTMFYCCFQGIVIFKLNLKDVKNVEFCFTEQKKMNLTKLKGVIN